jgi:hypothetical protein
MENIFDDNPLMDAFPVEGLPEIVSRPESEIHGSELNSLL